MGAKEEDTASSLLRLLHTDFREHPRSAPEGRRSRATYPAAPVNLSVVDLIDASVREVADHTRAVNPDAGPLPERVEAVYDWYRENTRHTDEAQRQRGEAMVYRQQLEHAIAMGDVSVIPPHRCPACRTFGLMWKPELERALCTNRRCLTRDGMSRTWELAKLAYEHVAAEKMFRVRAT